MVLSPYSVYRKPVLSKAVTSPSELENRIRQILVETTGVEPVSRSSASKLATLSSLTRDGLIVNWGRRESVQSGKSRGKELHCLLKLHILGAVIYLALAIPLGYTLGKRMHMEMNKLMHKGLLNILRSAAVVVYGVLNPYMGFLKRIRNTAFSLTTGRIEVTVARIYNLHIPILQTQNHLPASTQVTKVREFGLGF